MKKTTATTSIAPELLAAQFAKALPTTLRSVILFGSATTGEFVPYWSNYNLLVVCASLGLDELRALAPAAAAWARAGNPAPLLFTVAELTASRDAFPIELLDMQQSRRILWGDDLLADMRIERNHLRVQIERELKGKLLALRGRYLECTDHPAAVDELMLRSTPTFLVLFRAVLRLHEQSVPITKLAALAALAQHIAFDVRPFEQLDAHRRLPPAERGRPSGVAFDQYLRAIETVVRSLDPRPATQS